MKLFAFTFVFRPWLKTIILAAASVIAVLILLYVLKAVAIITKKLAGKN
jgi:hypothetical protein